MGKKQTKAQFLTDRLTHTWCVSVIYCNLSANNFLSGHRAELNESNSIQYDRKKITNLKKQKLAILMQDIEKAISHHQFSNTNTVDRGCFTAQRILKLSSVVFDSIFYFFGLSLIDFTRTDVTVWYFSCSLHAGRALLLSFLSLFFSAKQRDCNFVRCRQIYRTPGLRLQFNCKCGTNYSILYYSQLCCALGSRTKCPQNPNDCIVHAHCWPAVCTYNRICGTPHGMLECSASYTHTHRKLGRKNHFIV